MALAELRRRIPVHPAASAPAARGVRANRLYPGADVAISVITPIPTDVMVAPGQQRRRVGDTKRGRMKAVVLQPTAARRSAFGVGHGPPNALAAPKPDIVKQHHEHVGSALGGRSGSIGGNYESGSFASNLTSPVNGASAIGQPRTIDL